VKHSIARSTLLKARFFLDQAELVGTSNRLALESFLEAVVVFGRSVTFHLQKEFSESKGFGLWYSDQQAVMSADPLFGFFKEQRNFILKEGPVTVRITTDVSISETIAPADYVHLKVIRGQPWYRRQINILWQDFRRTLFQGVAGLEARRRHLAHQVQQRHSQDSLIVHERLHFDHPNWCDSSSFDLLRIYLDRLQMLVNEAECRFER